MAELPERPVWFIDRSLGRRHVPDALRAAGALVESHDDHFDLDTPDVDWLPVVGRCGWIVLTKDQQIRKNPLERGAMLEAAVRVFVLTGKNLTGPEMAKILVRQVSRMEFEARHRAAPFIATVTRSSIRFFPVR